MGDRDRRVQDEAYRIWNEAGRPEGRGDEHWYEAEKRIASEGEPVPSKAKKPKGVKPVVKGAGASGVVTKTVVANDAPKPRPTKGAAVDIAPAKPKKAKVATEEAPKAAAKEPAKPAAAKAAKPVKDKAEADKPGKAAKPKPKG
ncbi:DUF2934 domain-containing protein [Chenggangzhangella methanolivorans]|uniref:DUF2934 domain-containing protein n=1 Tax=Chenggangzhangella methanolivorans TaxID=1437009 RepID=A0A9E6R6V2_9HYPH|nr:DUF2934 domain-containing protein [Chenggangzhangella methanolivorans]QZN99320.1 DUF2934 domain-containing protein [Chenggangzhangella methanolivorans]